MLYLLHPCSRPVVCQICLAKASPPTDFNKLLKTGEIISLSCWAGCQGRCKDIFYAGITVAEVLAAARKTKLLHGALIIDEDFGFYFPLPSPHDELADSIAHLSTDFKLNTLHIEDVRWWFKPELSPSYAKALKSTS